MGADMTWPHPEHFDRVQRTRGCRAQSVVVDTLGR